MIDEDDDFQAVLDAALRDSGALDDRAKPVTPSSRAADEVDESEMTSVMGPEERQLLQQATRRGSEASASVVVREEESARPTARPPSSGSEQPVLIVGEPAGPTADVSSAPGEDRNANEGTMAPVVRQPNRRPRHIPLDWSVVAFILLAAAALYEVQR
jgi:hypothetical protein